MEKKDFLKEEIKHVGIADFDSTKIIEAMKGMSFTARDTANAALLFDKMIQEKDCTIILCIAGSTSAAGCMQLYPDMVKCNMVDAVVATGATIDRIYDTFIDEEQLQVCDKTVEKIADSLEPRPYSSREFIKEMGKYLSKNAKKPNSLIQAAYENNVPIFCPAFSDSSAGFGLALHQTRHKDKHVSIDSVKDFRELTEIKMNAPTSGLFMVGGGVPKNFAQDTVVCAEVLGKEVPMHKYAVQITVADVRDGACSSSTLKEARSWGKVAAGNDQMVFAEATSVLPLIASYAYHKGNWKKRKPREWAKIFR